MVKLVTTAFSEVSDQENRDGFIRALCSVENYFPALKLKKNFNLRPDNCTIITTAVIAIISLYFVVILFVI